MRCAGFVPKSFDSGNGLTNILKSTEDEEDSLSRNYLLKEFFQTEP